VSLPKSALKSSKAQPGISRGSLWYLQRFFVVMAVLVVISSVSALVTASVAAECFERNANVILQAAQACDEYGRDTNSSIALNLHLSSMYTEINALTSYYYLNKVAVLLLVIFIYVTIGPFCALILRQARLHIEKSIRLLASLDASKPKPEQNHLSSNESAASPPPVLPGLEQSLSSAGTDLRGLDLAARMLDRPLQEAIRQRRRLVVTFHVCLWSFLPRLAHDIMYLIGNWSSSRSLECGSCGTCQSFNWLVSEWLWQTPEFWQIASAISCPFPLAMSLLLLISDREKQLLRSGRAPEDTVEIGAKKIRDYFRISFFGNASKPGGPRSFNI